MGRTNAKTSISLVLSEDADVNLGPVGVEIEFLIRKDYLYGKKFANVAKSFGFNVKDDHSVSTRGHNTFEDFYSSCEIDSGEPQLWSSLAKRLIGLMAWLKREDYVTVDTSVPFRATVIVIGTPNRHPHQKQMKLPRGRVPANCSAGTHIHFDADTWFSDPEHARRFIQYWNQFQKEIPSHTLAGRYREADPGRGHTHANVTIPFDDVSTDPDSPSLPREYFNSVSAARSRGLNMTTALKRGDIEFRFLHSTLNFDTIAGWVKLLAEIIEAARKPSNGSFTSYVQREAPDSAKFMIKARNMAMASRPMKKSTIGVLTPTRAARKVFYPGGIKKYLGTGLI